MPYTESVVTFLDILGFGSMVSDEEQFDKIARTLNRLQEWTQFEDFQTEGFEQRATNFSDCCVRSTPIVKSTGESNSFGILSHEILDLVHAQLNLIGTESVLLRGAVTVGSLHHEEDQVFGPALVRAYYLETDVAQYPRIILDPRLIHRMKTTEDFVADQHDHEQEKGYITDWLKRDRDGIYFIDYLGLSASELDDVSESVLFLQRHRDLILAGAQAHGQRPSLAVKYNWLLEYHNDYVRTLNEDVLGEYDLDRSDFLIDESNLPFYQKLD